MSWYFQSNSWRKIPKSTDPINRSVRGGSVDAENREPRTSTTSSDSLSHFVSLQTPSDDNSNEEILFPGRNGRVSGNGSSTPSTPASSLSRTSASTVATPSSASSSESPAAVSIAEWVAENSAHTRFPPSSSCPKSPNTPLADASVEKWIKEHLLWHGEKVLSSFPEEEWKQRRLRELGYVEEMKRLTKMPLEGWKAARLEDLGYHSSRYVDGCFGGSSAICLADGTSKPVKELLKGDSVLCDASGITANVESVLVLHAANGRKQMVTFANGLQITGMHPILWDDEWVSPVKVGEEVEVGVDKVYNVVLDTASTAVVNGITCSVLGHADMPSAHPFWGNKERVVNGMEAIDAAGYEKGVVEIVATIRDEFGTVCGFQGTDGKKVYS